MKNTYKKLSLISLVAIGLLYSFKSDPKDEYRATSDEQSLERGKNLVYNMCGDCHYNKKTGKFTGNPMPSLPGIMGKLYSANLTDTKDNGVIPYYTDEQIYGLLRTGKKRDGGFAPYMLHPNLADKDINDIIVYLRSDDEAVSSDATTAGTTHVNLLGKLGTHIIAKPGAYKTGIPSPREDNAVEYGEYLVDNIGCYHCHSQSMMALNRNHPEDTRGYMQGGMKMKGKNGEKMFASNLTPDDETGIGRYTKEDFRRAVQDGIAADGKKLHAPMPKFKHLTDKQADAIYAYLMELPAKHHPVNRK